MGNRSMGNRIGFEADAFACSAYSAEAISDPATSFLQNPASANSVPRLRIVIRTPTAGGHPPISCLIREVILLGGLPFQSESGKVKVVQWPRATPLSSYTGLLCSGPRLSSAGKDGSRMCRSTRRRHIKGNSSSSTTNGGTSGSVIPVLDSRMAIER